MQSVAKICFILVLLGICHTNGRRLNGNVNEPMVLPFVCNSTNASSITIYTGDSFNYIIYDVAQKKCTNYSNYYKHRIESCVLNGKNFNLSFGQLNWNDKGNYTAWDDQGFFLDSIVVDIQDSNKSTQQFTYFLDSTTPKEGNENVSAWPAWPLGSSIVVIHVAAWLAIIAVLKYRQRKAKRTTTNKLADRNENQDTSFSLHNECHIYEQAPSPEESILILTIINNEHDLTDLSHNRGQDKVKQNAKQISDQGLRMFNASDTALQSDDDDERKYEEPDMELTAFLKPISQPVHVYERLHPYENQGNNVYRSLRPENII